MSPGPAFRPRASCPVAGSYRQMAPSVGNYNSLVRLRELFLAEGSCRAQGSLPSLGVVPPTPTPHSQVCVASKPLPPALFGTSLKNHPSSRAPCGWGRGCNCSTVQLFLCRPASLFLVSAESIPNEFPTHTVSPWSLFLGKPNLRQLNAMDGI